MGSAEFYTTISVVSAAAAAAAAAVAAKGVVGIGLRYCVSSSISLPPLNKQLSSYPYYAPFFTPSLLADPLFLLLRVEKKIESDVGGDGYFYVKIR